MYNIQHWFILASVCLFVFLSIPFNFDGDVAANVKCQHNFIICSHSALFPKNISLNLKVLAEEVVQSNTETFEAHNSSRSENETTDKEVVEVSSPGQPKKPIPLYTLGSSEGEDENTSFLCSQNSEKEQDSFKIREACY